VAANALGCSGGSGEPSSSTAQAVSAGDTLTGGQVMAPGDYLESSNGQYRLVMQGDGNLVEYWGSRVLFASNTSGHAGAAAELQTDGNLVVYEMVHGQMFPLWDSGKTGPAGATLRLQTDGNVVIVDGGQVLWNVGRKNQELLAGQTLTAGQFVASPSDEYEFLMQDDGNAVLYKTGGQAVWATGTNGTGADRIVMQTDGNLVVYAGGVAKWSSATNGDDGAHLDVEDDGSLEILTTSGRLAWWSACFGKSGYCNPLRDVSISQIWRIDQGVDYVGSGPVYALGMGTVVYNTQYDPGWSGGVISYQLTSGPASGDYVYLTEGVTPSSNLQPGDLIDARTVIATMTSDIETGWAESNGTVPLCRANGVPVYQDGTSTALGMNFNALLVSLHAPSGLPQPNAQNPIITGWVPQGWPSW
jgi:hypothetical protein